jgi:hypothetical protein
MLAAPTAMPVISRPTYRTGRWPREEACITVPTMATRELMISEVRRPKRSANQYAPRAPKKQPACKVETMLASRFAEATESRPSRPNFLRGVSVRLDFTRLLQGHVGRGEGEGWEAHLRNVSIFKTPPMIPVSIPNKPPAKQAWRKESFSHTSPRKTERILTEHERTYTLQL